MTESGRVFSEATAAKAEFAKRWSAELTRSAAGMIKNGGCVCGVDTEQATSEFSHTEPQCGVYILLRTGRLMLEDSRR